MSNYPSPFRSLRLALALAFVCGLSFIGWRAGASAPSVRLVNQLKSWGASMMTAMQATPVLNVGGITSTYTAGSTAVVIAPNLTLTGPNLDGARVNISTNFSSAQDRLGISGQGTNTSGTVAGLSWSYDTTTGILTFTGTTDAATYQAALRAVTYYNTSGSPTIGTRGIAIGLGAAVAFSGTGHFYESVDAGGNITWTAAKAAAEARTYYGLHGYLVTITSAAENSFAFGKINAVGWIGASDVNADKQWTWMGGPEAGQVFFYQNGYNPGGANSCGSGTSATQPAGGPYYSNWAGGEPNDCCGGCIHQEDYAHFLNGGTWNDYANTTSVTKYVVEYGGSATDPAVSLTGNTSVNVAAASANFTVSKSQPSPSLIAGQNSTYTITVTNTSTTTAGTTATVKDAIPNGLKLISATGSGWTCTPSSGNPNVGTITCNFSGTIAANNGTSTISVVVCPTAAGSVTNYVSVEPLGSTNAPDPTTCTGVNQPSAGCGAPVTSTVNTPVLAVSKSNPALNYNQNATYVITVTNNGTAAASTAQVKDALPAGLKLVSATGTNWTCSPSSGTSPVGTVTCNFSGGTIASAGGTSTINVVVCPTSGGSLTNKVSVDTTSGAAAPDPTTCTAVDTPSAGCGAPVTATVSGAPTETVSKSGTAGATPVGGNGTTTINWRINYGLSSTAPLSSVLNDTWSSGQTLVAASVQTPGGLWTSTSGANSLSFSNSLTAPNGKGQTQAFPRPLAGGVSFSGAGDGFNPALTASGKVMGVNHHFSNGPIWCYDLNTGLTCTGYNPKPTNAGATGYSPATVAIGNRIYYSDDSSNNAFGQTGHIYCWDSDTNSSCGQSPQVNNLGLAVVNGKLFTQTRDGKLDCYDPANSLNRCGGFTVVNLGMPTGSTLNFVAPNDEGGDIFAVGTKIYLANYERKLTCFDAATNTTCAGWPALPSVVSTTATGNKRHNIIPRLNAGGTITGICVVGYRTNATCYNFDSSNPTEVTMGSGNGAMITAFPGLSAHVETWVGSRIFFANHGSGNTGIGCFDWATQAACTGTGFDASGQNTTNSGSAYGLTNDGVSVYSFGDGGVLRSYNPLTGVSPSNRIATVATVNIDSFYCGSPVAATWDKVILSDINLTAGVEFTSLLVSVIDTSTGTTVFGPTEAVGTSGVFDISSVSSSIRTLRLQIDESPVNTVAWNDNVPPKGTLTFTNNSPVRFCYQTQVTCSGMSTSYTNTINTTLDPHTATASVTACQPTPNLAVSKSTPSPALTVGQNSTYTLTVTNNGQADATTATVQDALPIGLDLVSATGTGWTCSPNSTTSSPIGTITCNFSGTITSGGGTSTIAVVVKPLAAYGGTTVINYASVDPTSGVNPPTPTNCTAANTPAGCAAPVSSTITAVPSLSVSKSQPSPLLVTGQNSTYTITVSNSGSAAATTATVKEAIPAGMKLISATGTNWTCTPSSGNAPVGAITCNFSGTIAATNGTSTISVVVCPTASGSVTNYVSVDPTSGANAPDPTTCTALNTPTAGCGAPVTSNGFAPGAALDFDGVNAGVNIDSLRSAVSGLTSFTMELWLKPAASGNLQVLWSGDTQNYIQFPVSGNGLLLEFGGTGNIVWQKNNFFTLGSWQHVAFVFDGNQASANRWKIYKDGVLVTPDTVSAMSASIAALAGQMLLGAWSGGGYNYNGQMDDARFWNRALCADEIQAHLNCELLGNEAGLLAYYKFNQGIAGGTNTGVTTLIDASPNGRNGTLNNFALSGATSNWVTPGGVTTGATCAVFLAPEIDVLGNNTSIADGDTTPSATDDTDFGSVNVASGTVTRTFTIANTGPRQLLLTGTPKVAIGGTHASDFTVTLQPTSPVAATNGTTTFTIVFDPSGVGTRTATVTIENDDCDEGPYNFSIQGTGLNQAPTITAGATATRQQGTAGSSATIATVSDDITAAGSVNVTATTVPAGITITGISNSGGTVTATVAASCTATLGNNTVVLTATDGNGAMATANFIVNVTANSAPTVGTYAATAVALGGAVTVTPNAAPADNGTIASVTATASPNTFTGSFSGDTSTGAVTVMNAGPTGTYTITVTVTDNCGATVTKTFTLMVDMCAPAPSNLGLWYRAEGNANAFVGGINAATATNSGQASPTSPTYATGKVGQAWSFNGTTDALDSGATTILNTFPVTIEAWVNPALRNDAGTTNLSGMVYPNNVISNDKAGFYGHGFGVNVTPNGSQFTIEYNDGFRVVPQANASFSAGQWYHIVVVYGLTGSQGSFKAYVNGQLVDQLTYGQGIVDGLSLIRIGYHNDDNGYGTRRFFKGLLDEVSIYQGCALQLSDIQALYQAGAAGKCLSPLNLNTPPTITPAGTLSRSRGSSSVSQIATVSDTETPAGNLTVAVQSAPTGITVTNIQNTNGAITATVAADCTATLGNNTVVLYVSDGACATPFANLIVNVTANTAPTVGTYANTGVAAGGSVTVTPSAAPADNGSIQSVTAAASPNTFTGTFSTNTATGAVTITNAGPSGTYTITVTVTDNCGATVQQTFALTVNTAPTINAFAATRQQGSPASNSTIATVSDVDQTAGSLMVAVTSANPSNGVTVSNIVNTNGTITANIVAACTAANATFTLTVTDSTNAMTTASLNVTVTANTAPTVGTYANQTLLPGGGVTVTPSAAPADNGSIQSVTAAASPNTFTGTFSTNTSTGAVTITNAGPSGAYTITVTVTDNCGATVQQTFTLLVNAPPTLNAGATATRQQGTAGSTATLATVSDDLTAAGSVMVAATTVPAGISITNIINTNGAITATVAASCTATLGNNTVVLTATDGNGATSTANFVVNVTANTAPTVGAYANTGVAAGGTTTVTPNAAPADNGSIASVTATAVSVPPGNTFTGMLSGDTATGAVTITNAGPSGTYTLTVTVTDNCGATVQQTFTLTVNTAPTINAVAATRQQGVPVSNSTIANVGDVDQSAGSLTVKVNNGAAATVNGVTVGNLVNTNGVITADIVADCAATLGNASFTLSVTDSSNATATATLTVNVTANTPPTLGNYPNTGPVNVSTGTTVTPSAAPADNVAVASATASASGFTGALAVDKTTGVVTITNAGPPGTYTVNVTVTDNCNEMTVKSFQLVVNGPPTVTPGATLTRQQGTAASNSTLAVLDDDLTAKGSLTVSLVSAPAGLNVTNLLNTNGTVTANVAADCSLAAGPQSFVIKARDAGGLETQATINVTVTANDPPTLSYQAQLATAGTTKTVNPNTGPSDNGTVVSIIKQSQGTFGGTVSVDNTTGVVTLTDPKPTGTHTITIRATDNCGAIRDASFTVAIGCPLITVGPVTIAAATTGESYAQAFTQANGVGTPTFSVSVGTLPNGLTLNAQSGQLTGIPTQTGSFPITVRATDGNQCFGETQYTLVVNCPATTLAPTSANSPTALPTATAGLAYSQTFNATPARTYNFTVSTGTLPNGVTLNAATGVLSGNPTQTGTFNFTVKATDQYTCFGTRAYTLTVGCPAMTVSPTNASLIAGAVGTGYSQSFTVSNAFGNSAAFTVSGGSLPNGLTLSNTGALTGTPTRPGTFTFTVRAVDSLGCAGTREYTLVINCTPLSITPATLSGGQANTLFSQQLTSTGAGPWQFSLAATPAPPAWLSITAGGLLSGTPPASSSYQFTVNVTDANGCTGTQSYTLNANCTTVTLGALPAATAGTAYSATLSATPAGTYQFTSSDKPAWLTLASNGALSGTPPTAGTVTFNVSVSGSGACTQSMPVTLTVSCPTLTVNPATLPDATLGTAYSQTLSATPGGGQTFSVTTGTLPNGLTLASNGTLSGTPTAAGAFTFTVTATAFGACTGTRSYTLTVAGTCTALTVGPATTTLSNGTLGTAYSQTFTATGGSGALTFSVSSGSLPTGLTLNASTGVLSGTPTAGVTAAIFAIKASTPSGCTGQRTYTLTITCPTITLSPANPVLPDATAGRPYSLQMSATPASPYAFTLQLGQLPPGFTLNRETGLLTGLSTQVGTYTFTLKAGAGICGGTRAYTITVKAAAAALARLADYDGDGKADPALWNPQRGQWEIIHSHNQQAITQEWGAAGDISLLGDYDGDGQSDLAVFRPSDGNWYIKPSGGGAPLVITWGQETDVPVPGDYDGDGQTDLAVFRPSDGNWYVLRSSDQQAEITAWGAGYAPYLDVPVPGDYDGDGRTDVAVFRRSTGTWLVKRCSDGQVEVKAWGQGTDVPVANDYDGDGKTDFAVWRAVTGVWYIWQSATQSYRTAEWGAGLTPYQDEAVPGDYDGDGLADIAVWRAADQQWYIRCSVDGSLRAVAQGQAGSSPVATRLR